MRATKLGFVICALVLGYVSHAPAAIVTFYGIDAGVAPGAARPNADAAAAAFDAAAGALGTVNLIDFESGTLGGIVAPGVAPGVTVNLTGMDSGAGLITGAGSITTGYNITPGGDRWLRFLPTDNIGTATLTYSFLTPIQAFGTYITGLGTANGNMAVQFSDGTSQSIDVSGNSAGGALFFGFTDAGASINSISLSLTGVVSPSRDISGHDDVRYVFASAEIPEPGSMTLLGLGFMGMAAGAMRKRRRA